MVVTIKINSTSKCQAGKCGLDKCSDLTCIQYKIMSENFLDLNEKTSPPLCPTSNFALPYFQMFFHVCLFLSMLNLLLPPFRKKNPIAIFPSVQAKIYLISCISFSGKWHKLFNHLIFSLINA